MSHEIALVDVFENKLKGELMDLQHGSNFLKNANIQASTDVAVSAGSQLIIVTGEGTFGNYVTQKMEFLDPPSPSVTTFTWFPALKNHTV